MFEGFNEKHLEEAKRNENQGRGGPSWGQGAVGVGAGGSGRCGRKWQPPTGSPAALSWERWATLGGLSASSSQSSQPLPHSARLSGSGGICRQAMPSEVGLLLQGPCNGVPGCGTGWGRKRVQPECPHQLLPVPRCTHRGSLCHRSLGSWATVLVLMVMTSPRKK